MPWKVVILESERGGGQSVVDVRYFDTENEANEFETTFNSKNTEKIIPDWYMVAMPPEKVIMKL